MKTKEPSIFILLLLSSFASVSAVLFTPGLPEIARFLGISNGEAQWSITLFIIGYAVGNLPWGPFSNQFGRKPAIFSGISLSIIGCILILLVVKFPFYWLFLLGRFLSALGSCVGLKVAFTMIGDVYQHEKAVKKISSFMLAFAIGPGIAVAVGGLLTEHWGWVSTFYFLTAYSVLVLILSFFLPETCQEKVHNALNISKVVTGYLNKFKNSKLILCALLMGCGTSCVYLFAAVAPFIGIDYIGLSPDQYGLWNFIPPIGMLIGTTITHRLVGKWGPLSILLLGIVIFLSGSIAMLILFSTGIINSLSLFLPMPFLYMGTSLLFANASGLAMTHAKDKSNGSAIMNFINMGTSVISVFIISLLPQKFYILPLAFFFLAVCMFLLRKNLTTKLSY